MASLLSTALLAAVLAGMPPAAYGSEAARERVRAGYREAVESSDTLMDAELKAVLRGGTLMARHGYTPVQVTLQNNTAVPRVVSLSFQGNYGVSDHRGERTVEVGPKQRVVTHLLVSSDVQAGMMTLRSPGLEQASQSFYMESANGGAVLVLGTPREFESSTSMARVEEEQEPLVTSRFVDPQGAPRELAAYAGYDAVLVAVEAEAVPSDLWATLEQYAVTGGRLVLAHPPRDMKARLPLLGAHEDGVAAYGFGQVRLCDKPSLCGTVLAEATSGSADAAGMVSPVGPAQRWERGSALRGGEQPLLSSARAPVGRFLVLIFLFVLAVGPGGLMLARRKGPVAVLVAVPTVALVTCLALVTWSVLVDGFSIHAARYSLTWLDRERSRAVSVGLGAWYANLSTESVRLPASSVLVPAEGGEVVSSDIDWTQGLTVRSGFLPSRTYREWGEVGVLPSRARLVARREGDSVVVQNALGGPMRGGTLYLGGVLWSLPALADGEQGRATLYATGADAALDTGLSEPAQHRFPGALGLFRTALPEGGFQARLGGAGPLPTASVPVDLEDGLHLVRGQVEEGRK